MQDHDKSANKDNYLLLNRSKKWLPAYSYKQARMLSPFPDKPVK
jgi:hypothetical protein